MALYRASGGSKTGFDELCKNVINSNSYTSPTALSGRCTLDYGGYYIVPNTKKVWVYLEGTYTWDNHTPGPSQPGITTAGLFTGFPNISSELSDGRMPNSLLFYDIQHDTYYPFVISTAGGGALVEQISTRYILNGDKFIVFGIYMKTA